MDEKTPTESRWKRPSPVMAGLRRRCPRCGEGRVFSAYLKLKPSCDVCGQDFSRGDTGDGPAFFVGFVSLILFAPFFFLIPLTKITLLAKLLVMAVLMAGLVAFCLLMLPIGKAMLLALQVHHGAEQGRTEDDEKGAGD